VAGGDHATRATIACIYLMIMNKKYKKLFTESSLQLLWAASACLVVVIVYYLRHRPLRETVARELMQAFRRDPDN
jgi:hypothetical protein